MMILSIMAILPVLKYPESVKTEMRAAAGRTRQIARDFAEEKQKGQREL